MPRNHEPLSRVQRMTFSSLMAAARSQTGLSLNKAAAEASAVLERWEMHDLTFDFEFVRWLETSPAIPLANPHRLAAVLRVYRLGWGQVLEALGVDNDFQEAGARQ